MSVPLDLFRKKRPIYIDYPFESAAFRWMGEDSETYKKFYLGDEVKIPFSDNLFREAIRSGDVISKEEYDRL